MCEYEKGVKTVPKVGYLFAFPYTDNAEKHLPNNKYIHYWIAEAEVVGYIIANKLSMRSDEWNLFWNGFKPQMLVQKQDTYLLCSSITLIKEVLDK